METRILYYRDSKLVFPCGKSFPIGIDKLENLCNIFKFTTQEIEDLLCGINTALPQPKAYQLRMYLED